MMFIGMMSGTSMDAVDAVLADFSAATVRIVDSHSTAIPVELQQRLREFRADSPVIEAMRLDDSVAELFAETALALVRKAGINIDQIAAIGSHGQTLWHAPDETPASTLQVGNPNRIALQTGITTIADFRRMDMAAGGQGAPLVPVFHNAIFRHNERTRVVVNLGGIANITVLSANPDDPVLGFDTGPANNLMDNWIRRQQQQAFDTDGAWAASGKINPALLQQLQADPYFSQLPPKSTGPEYFNLGWLEKMTGNSISAFAPEDIQATLLALTATTIAADIRKYASDAKDIILCGGGAFNKALCTAIATELKNCKVSSSADYGIDPRQVEACCFAWLAMQRLAGNSINTTSITGAHQAVMLGGIYQA